MEKFTHVKKAEASENKETLNILYKNDKFKVVQIEDSEMLISYDNIYILPYVKDEGIIYCGLKNIPSFKYRYRNHPKLNNITNYLTVINDTFKQGENVQQAIRRMLYEKVGLVLNQFYNLQIEYPLFNNEHDVFQTYHVLLELNYNDYKQVAIIGDNQEKTIKVSLGDIDEVKFSDINSQYLITKLKKEYNL